MNALAIDTATPCLAAAACSAAGRAIRLLHTERNHEPFLAGAIRDLLDELSLCPAELDLIAVGTGPGSFTALRIGLSTTRALAQGLRIPLFGMPTLDLLAAPHPGVSIPVVDARKGRLFAALYRDGRRLSPFLDEPPDEIARIAEAEGAFVCGPAAGMVPLRGGNAAPTTPDAGFLLDIACGESREGRVASGWDVRPCYARETDAEIFRRRREGG